MARNIRHSVTSFTLLELVLAMSVLLAVVTLLTIAANSITASWAKVIRERQRFDEILKLDATLDNMLGNIVPFHWQPDDTSGRQLIFTGEPDQVSFAYIHRLNSAASGTLRFCRLLVSGTELVVWHQNRPLIDLEASPPPKQSLLAENVKRIEVSYADWDPEAREVVWVRDWNVENERRRPPLAVAVWVYWQDGRWECWLRRTAGNGYQERWGKGGSGDAQ